MYALRLIKQLTEDQSPTMSQDAQESKRLKRGARKGKSRKIDSDEEEQSPAK